LKIHKDKVFIPVYYFIPDKFSFKGTVHKVRTMGKTNSTNNTAASMAVSRYILGNYYSVQFSLNDMGPIYLFKLRNISLNGPCILVREDSSVFKQLEVGNISNMEFNPMELSVPKKLLKTKIISKNAHDLFTGHSLVGLSIVKEQN
jgi:hypothetical protein